MNNVSFKYNLAIELLISIEKYISLHSDISKIRNSEHSKIEKLEAESYIDFTPNINIKNWASNVDKKISPFLKNDIEYIFGTRPNHIIWLYDFIICSDINSANDLILEIDNLSFRTLLDLIFKTYKLQISLENDDDTLRNEISLISGIEEANLFIFLN